jgi:hypothetical protein
MNAGMESAKATEADHREDFDRLEETIRRGLHTFIDVGGALLEINERKLYLTSGFSSFTEYAEKRWGISRSYAYRQIEAARVVGYLEQAPDLPPPANESQARELARLSSEPEALREVWADALRDADGKVTAGDLRRRIDVRKRRRSRTSPETGGGSSGEMTCPHCGGTISAKQILDGRAQAK